MSARLAMSTTAAAVLAAALLAAPQGAVGHGEEEHDGAEPAAAEPAAAEAAATEAAEAAGHEPADVRLAMPMMNSERGMRLFVDKGCVACHAVNGVGGHHALALDAHGMDPVMNPFELAAKMWRMAPAMIAAQEEALGYQITFTGEQLADIVAFLHDDAQQHELTGDALTPEVRRMMDHKHPGPGGGPAAHAEEIGHEGTHGEAGHHD